MSAPAVIPFAPFDPARMIQTCWIHQQTLRIAFAPCGDRMVHSIALVERIGDADRITPLCSSVEGTANETWPASSPLQSLSIEQRATGDVALLVGMAGRSHWSASFETFAGLSKLRIEHACRVGGEPTWLGSGYQLPTGELVIEHNHAHEVIQLVGKTRIRWRSEQIEMSDSHQLNFPAIQPWHAKPVRWQYALEIV